MNPHNNRVEHSERVYKNVRIWNAAHQYKWYDHFNNLDRWSAAKYYVVENSDEMFPRLKDAKLFIDNELKE